MFLFVVLGLFQGVFKSKMNHFKLYRALEFDQAFVSYSGGRPRLEGFDIISCC